MKKVFIKLVAILIICLSIVLCSCGQKVKTDKIATSNESMFVLVEETISWRVVYHKKTKVMYAVSMGPYNTGNFTLLVDENGMPLLWQGE